MARSGCSALHRSVIKRSTDSILRVLEVDRQVLRMDRWVLHVDKRVLRVGKRAQEVGEVYY